MDDDDDVPPDVRVDRVEVVLAPEDLSISYLTIESPILFGMLRIVRCCVVGICVCADDIHTIVDCMATSQNNISDAVVLRRVT